MINKEDVISVTTDISPPVVVTAATVFGYSPQEWVVILTIVYTIVRLLAFVPRLIGCGCCFYKNKGCSLKCKNPIS